MNHAKDKSPLPLPDVLREDLAVSSQKRDGLSNSHIVHIHVDPIVSVASTAFCKTHPNHSDKHSITISSDAVPPIVDGNSSCQDQSLTGLFKLDGCAAGSDSTCDDSEEDRPGSFDYMPRQKGHVRIAPAVNPAYDEEVKLDSSTASSVIESPRSDDSQAEEKADVTEVVKDTRRKHKHICWNYMPHCGQKSDNDDDDEDTNDEEEDDGDRGLGGASSRSSLSSSCPRAATKEVDECVSYNLKPLNGPNAGQLNGPSAGQLNGPSTGQNNQLITPLSYSLYQDRWMSEDSKEKDKKRGRSKDDTDKPEASAQVDGNPRLLDPANYLQMHQWSRNKVDSTASGSLSSYPPITISHSHAASGADPSAFDRKKERRRMKLERLKGTPAEEIQGHRKFNDIKEILAFVEGTNTAKGESKPARKKQERSRKRDLHLEGAHALEDTVAGDDGQNKEESFVVTASVQSVPRAMGNSFRRSFDENISKSVSEDEDVDKSNGEFQDCLSTLPVESATTNREQQQKLNGFLVGIEKTYPTAADQFDAFSAEESPSEKHVADGVGKKASKSRTKKEKQDSVGNNHGHLIAKSNIVKRKDSLEMKDSLLRTSVTRVESVKSETAGVKGPHLDMKRDDSFTEVTKRKKRPGVKDGHAIFPGHFLKSYNNSHGSPGIPHHRFQHRTSTPPPPPPVTLPAGSQIVTLPAGSQIVTLPAGSQAHTLRDLSPSAFPVLPGQGQPLSLHPEARRNSCGDLNSDSLDSRTYDSDRESAKSLPAAHGAAAGGVILPVCPLSYARIAAAPRKHDTTCNTSLESSVASIPQNSSVNCSISNAPGNIVLPRPSTSPAVTPERKTTVWKGSPRERRHSIGSSPKDKVEEGKTSVAEKNRQCGSQEVLSKNTVSSAGKAAKHATVSSSAVKQVHLNDSSSTHTNLQTEAVATSGNVASKLADSCSPMETKPMAQSTGNTDTVASDTGSPEYAISSSPCSAQDSSIMHPIISSQLGRASTASEAPKEVGIQLSAVKSTQAASALASGVRSQTLPPAEANSKTVVNKSQQNCHTDAARKTPKKSVVFLDRRFDESPPQNLGITFGFDSSYDTASGPTSHQPQLPFPSHHQSLPAGVALPPLSLPSSSSPPPSQSCQHFPAPAVSHGHPNIPQASHPTAVASANSLLFTSSPLPGQSGENSRHPPKGPHIHGPCNGLIFPSGPPRRSSVDQSHITSDNSTSGDSSNSSSVRSNCSVSYQEIASSGRTSASGLKPAEMDNLLVTCDVHKNVASAVIPAVDQLNTSLPHAVITNKHTTNAHLNSSEATLPHADPSGVDRESSSSPLPSAQERQEVASPHQGDLELPRVVLREHGQDPSALAKAEAAGSAVSSSSAATGLFPGETASQQPKQDLGEPPAAHSLAVPVVYGLKIKSGVGCGKLLYVPCCVSKKNRLNNEELCNFLGRRWLEEVTQKRGAETFITLSHN